MRSWISAITFVVVLGLPLACSDDPSGPEPEGRTLPTEIWGGEISGSDLGTLRRIALAPDGTFYLIGGELGTTLFHVDDRARYIDEWSEAGPHTFGTLGDVVVADDGTVFLSDTGNSLIYVLGPDGQFLTSWDGGLMTPKTPATRVPFNGPRGIALSGTGELYIVDTGNNMVQVYDAGDGVFIDAWPVPAAGTGNFDVPFAIAVDGSEVYIVSEPSTQDYNSTDPQVQAFNPDGVPLRAFGPPGNNDTSNQLDRPVSIDIGPDGRVYITEFGGLAPKVMSKQGVFAQRVAMQGGLLRALFQSATDLAIDPATGVVYAADGFWQTIQEIRGVNDVAWRQRAPVGDGEFHTVHDVAVGADGNVYTLDLGRGIQVFSPTGEFIRNFLPYVGPQMEIGVDAAGNVYVYYFVIGVHVFNPAGEEIDFWTPDPLFGHFKMAVAPSGIVYLPLTDQIVAYDSDGTSLGGWSLGTAGASNIVELATDVAGDVYALTQDRVYRFKPDGTPVRSWSAALVGAGGFAEPTALAADGYGFVFVADVAAGEIYVFAPDGTLADTFGSSPGALSQDLLGLAADPAGRVFLADGSNNRVIRFFWEFIDG